MSGTADISAVSAMFESGPLLCDRLTAAGLGWSEQGDQTANGAYGISPQCNVSRGALMCLERLKVADGLSLSERAERIEFPRHRQIGLHRIDQFEEEPAVWPPLV